MIQAPNGSDEEHTNATNKNSILEATDIHSSQKPRKRNATAKASSNAGTDIIQFRHDSGNFGSPKQAWTVVQKCIWLMYVLEKTTTTKEYTASQLTATYNRQFKAAGKLHPPHVPRELSAAKVSNPAPVGEDKNMWFLTDEGKHQALALIKESLGS